MILSWLLDVLPGSLWGAAGGVARRSVDGGPLRLWVSAAIAGSVVGVSIYQLMAVGLGFGVGISLPVACFAGMAADLLILGWRNRAQAVLDWLVRRLIREKPRDDS